MSPLLKIDKIAITHLSLGLSPQNMPCNGTPNYVPVP